MSGCRGRRKVSQGEGVSFDPDTFLRSPRHLSLQTPTPLESVGSVSQSIKRCRGGGVGVWREASGPPFARLQGPPTAISVWVAVVKLIFTSPIEAEADSTVEPHIY